MEFSKTAPSRRKNGLVPLTLLVEYDKNDVAIYYKSENENRYVVAFWDLLPLCSGKLCPAAGFCLDLSGRYYKYNKFGKPNEERASTCNAARVLMNQVIDFYLIWFRRNSIDPHTIQRFGTLILPLFAQLIVYKILAATVKIDTVFQPSLSGADGKDIYTEIRKITKDILVCMRQIGIEAPVSKISTGDAFGPTDHDGDPDYYESLS